ncbi:MAG: cyclic nucleotide-binding domain-containing protein [Candidatus Latescibacteria bacterium]|nr:cyclic nucleotide-binding domain-containing protein [Candidatus Latescibacterota bacterium]
MEKNYFWSNPLKKSGHENENYFFFLSSVPIFDSLTRRQIDKLQRIIHIRNFSKDEIVFRQGDPGVGLYIVKDGSVDVYNELNDMTCHKITTLNHGDFFGETSLLNETPRSATIISAEQSVLWGLFKPDLLNLFDSDPKLGLRLIFRLSQIVAERLRLLNNSLCGIQ